jgi:hypothetical protein
VTMWDTEANLVGITGAPLRTVYTLIIICKHVHCQYGRAAALTRSTALGLITASLNRPSKNTTMSLVTSTIGNLVCAVNGLEYLLVVRWLRDLRVR